MPSQPLPEQLSNRHQDHINPRTVGQRENDLYNNEPAVDGGATAELVAGPLLGTLECGSDPGFDLCPDGSFNFTPDGGFPGSDSFTYRAVVGTETAEATVTLTACGTL